jgi:phosphopentomutase
MQYGHRNDPAGLAANLADFDAFLPRLTGALGPGDLLAITADHGCDPTTPSSDHSREHVPLLLAGPDLPRGIDLGTRPAFADLGATLARLLGLPAPPHGADMGIVSSGSPRRHPQFR